VGDSGQPFWGVSGIELVESRNEDEEAFQASGWIEEAEAPRECVCAKRRSQSPLCPPHPPPPGAAAAKKAKKGGPEFDGRKKKGTHQDKKTGRAGFKNTTMRVSTNIYINRKDGQFVGVVCNIVCSPCAARGCNALTVYI
jgi:hypothetical protein